MILIKPQIEFRPMIPFQSGYMQTIMSRYWPQLKEQEPPSERKLTLDDGDKILLYSDRPKKCEKQRVILMVHGLGGCYQSSYMIRISQYLKNNGYLVYRMNLRRCGPGLYYANKPAHGGCSGDVLQVIEQLSNKFDSRPITALGFSLGANILIKLAGEIESKSYKNLDQIIAVSPPMDLSISVDRIGKSLVFQKYFLHRILKEVREFHNFKNEKVPVNFPKGITLRDFDRLYTAPFSGYLDENDYYSKCSAQKFIASSKTSMTIITSKDDPVVDAERIIEFSNPNVNLLLTQKGGHVGYLGSGTRFWLDHAVESNIKKEN